MIRILVVEDDEMLREILAVRLSLHDYDVAVTDNGQDAVHMAQADKLDVILMDMHLPVLTGWEAVRLLKSAPETASIPVIALTAHSLTDDREKSLAAGCDDHESKPVNFDRLLRKIKQLISSSQ